VGWKREREKEEGKDGERRRSMTTTGRAGKLGCRLL